MANTFVDYFNDAQSFDRTWRCRVASALYVEALFRCGAGKTPTATEKALAARVFNNVEGMAALFALGARTKVSPTQQYGADLTDTQVQTAVQLVFDSWVLAGA